MNYSHGPILTDCGGFQVFSLGDMRKITEEGVIHSDEIGPLLMSEEVKCKMNSISEKHQGHFNELYSKLS